MRIVDSWELSSLGLFQQRTDVLGTQLPDPTDRDRRWFVISVFSPIVKRRLAGLRLKVIDDRGFFSFINRRDFEVLTGVARVGAWCAWAGCPYVSPKDKDWCGYFVDPFDLADDLQERELLLRVAQLRQQGDQRLPCGCNLFRRIHYDDDADCEEELQLQWDEGYSDLDTIDQRWKRVDRRKIDWRAVPLLNAG